MSVAHLAFDLGAGHKGRNRIDHNDIKRAAAHKCFCHFKGLLSGIGLTYKKLVNIDAEFLSIRDIQRMFSVDKSSRTAAFLCLGNRVERNGSLAARLRTKNLYHASLGKSSYS